MDKTKSKRVRAVGVIPARYGSTRLPGKSLIPICGKPLVVRVVERARQCAALERVIVATDDERIAHAVTQAGAEAVMTRADHPSGTDRVAEAVQHLEADIVVNVQGDEPLIDPALIGQLVEALAWDPGWDAATAATPILTDEMRQNPAVVKVVWDVSGRALYFSRSLIPFVRDPGKVDVTGLHYRHLGIYAYRRSFLTRLVATPPCATERAECLEQLRALHIGGRMLVVPTDDPGIGVDTPADVAYVERVIRERGLE
ncbi:MAG: 3-deoxy-manno-octulosonate cytidylyltransferase [Lentisphaerae bacterium]|nr:3-deoxy-manno-octulosonate cytidylyltransferase [Lentisphaerota bacterium]